ncbi:hypothetical protein [Zobellia galactanivorans]|uniref:hypothetical protein n=1 Tax=Zobellia galactanivorans (strain DSM 12802 / CCUG 47099 / CIP 106680 / NCIMB 13871 / Dsij) TaxID=63186 RepID=UPI001C064A5D|nr:hypothetical protein [Zobellia galactanivorans]MBU3024080.1 hypothetical protein [Zobellia galactanivorans]
MKINKEYSGTIIGAIFTTISLLLIFTIIVPPFSIMPGTLVEMMISDIVNREPYSDIITIMVFIFSILFLILTVTILLRSKKKIYTNKHLIGIMILEYFVIHILGFYIYWATALDFTRDGQIYFEAVESFKYSSFGFILVGLLIDIIKKNGIENNKFANLI